MSWTPSSSWPPAGASPGPGRPDERVVVAIEPLPGPGPGPVRLDPAEAGFEVDPDVLDHAEFGIGVISGRSIPGHGPGGHDQRARAGWRKVTVQGVVLMAGFGGVYREIQAAFEGVPKTSPIGTGGLSVVLGPPATGRPFSACGRTWDVKCLDRWLKPVAFRDSRPRSTSDDARMRFWCRDPPSDDLHFEGSEVPVVSTISPPFRVASFCQTPGAGLPSK